MAAITYDVSDVEPRTERKVPKPGVYKCKVVGCVDAKPSGKDRRLEMQYDIIGGDYDGSRLFDYVNLVSEGAAWRLRMLIDALGLPAKGKLDPDKIIGKEVLVRTKIENSEQYGASAKVAALLTSDDEAELEEADDEVDDTDDESGADDETWTEEELKELSVDELKEQCGEYELDATAVLKGKKTAAQKKSALIAAILEAQGGDEDEDESDDEDEADETETEAESDADEEGEDELWTQEELEALNSKELKEVAEEYDGVKVPTKLTSAAKAKVIAAILESQGGDEEDSENGEVDYSAMDLSELKEELKKRGLGVKGTKTVLVRRLEKDDEPV